MTISSLPPELYTLIFEYLDQTDLVRLCLVSRAFRDISQDLLFQTLTIGKTDPNATAKHLTLLSKLPHLTSKLRILNAHVDALGVQEEATHFDELLYEGEVEEFSHRTARLSIRLTQVMAICYERLEALHLVGHGAFGYVFENNICGAFFANMFCELLSTFEFPRLQTLSFRYFDPRSFATFLKMSCDGSRNKDGFETFQRNISRIQHFSVDYCIEGGNIDDFTIDHAWQTTEYLAAKMPLRSLAITRNPEFTIPLHNVAKQGALTKIDLQLVEVAEGLEKLIENNPQLAIIRFEKVMLDMNPEIHNAWSTILERLKNCKFLRKLRLSHLTYQTSSEHWMEYGTESLTIWDYHDGKCGTDGRKILCSQSQRSKKMLDDQEALRELYKSLPRDVQFVYHENLSLDDGESYPSDLEDEDDDA